MNHVSDSVRGATLPVPTPVQQGHGASVLGLFSSKSVSLLNINLTWNHTGSIQTYLTMATIFRKQWQN